MGRYNKLISIVTLSVMVLGLTMVASAQWRDRRGNNDYYGGNTYNLKRTIRSLEGNTRIFVEKLDRELDRSRYDGSRREDNLNRLAKKLRSAADDLDDEFDDQRDYRNTSDEARKVLSYGTQLDRALSRSRITRGNYELRNNWRNIETDLRFIAKAYRLSYNGNYGRRNGRYGRNDRTNRRDNRRGNNRRRTNRNGRYGNLRSTIVNLKYKSERFEDRLDRESDHRYGRRSSRNLENLSDRFHDAVKDLEDEYDNDRDYNDSYDEVRRVLSLGEQLDREISRRGTSRSIRNEWNSIERDLRTIASAYNVSYNGRNNRRGAGIGDILRNFPF